MCRTVRTRFARGLMMDMNCSFSWGDSDRDNELRWDGVGAPAGAQRCGRRSRVDTTSKGGATPTGSPGAEAPVATDARKGGRSPLAGDPTPTHEAPH